jgi:NADPH-dependent 2,4-dienoyl-CoA reductase/sulfur reductase-like enzyme
MPERSLVVVGASLAGLRAVETARRLGFDGRITLVGAEEHLPYDRPPLSKAFLTGEPAQVPALCTLEALQHDLAVDLRLGAPATELDATGRRVRVADEWIGYDGLVVATGVHARTIPEFHGIAGVHALRTIEDAEAIRSAMSTGARVVVLGAGFIGSEVASSARAKGSQVTVVEAGTTPLGRAVGPEMGRTLSQIHRDHGTDLRCATKIEAVEGAGRVERVRLSDGRTVECDLLVLGVGAVPNTDWLRTSGLTLSDGLLCAADLAAGAPGVYGAGDVARWPNHLLSYQPMRLEHWTNAAEQGGHAVRSWLSPDSAKPFLTVPYFWSDWYGSRVQFVGASDGDEILVAHGSPEQRRFVALYRKKHRLIGALAVNRPALVMKYRGLIAKAADWSTALEFARQH